jgi:hypothetical protein
VKDASNMKTVHTWVVAGALWLCACGEPPPFVSDVYVRVEQLETCKVVGDRSEQCVQQESTADRLVSLREDSEDRAWIFGVRLNGLDNRTLLGSVASDGGWVFYSETTEVNSVTACTIRREKTLSLALPDGKTRDDVVADACVGLTGREIDVVSLTAGCDTLNDPPLAEVRTEQRRWRPVPAEVCSTL